MAADDGGRLVGVRFGRAEEAATLDALRRSAPAGAALVRSDARVRPLLKQVRDYLAGKRADFDCELDLSGATPFVREVMLEAARIPRGEVASYGELAARVGRPRASRAVGNVMRTNPLPLVIPCHRVVGSTGLGGYGSAGLETKRWLLALEGASIS